MRSTVGHPEASRQSFELIATLVSGDQNQSVTMDNFPGLVAVLDEFATAASVAVEAQQQGRRTQALTSAKCVARTSIVDSVAYSSLLSSPVVERGRRAVDMVSDLKKFWAPFSETAGLQQSQCELLTASCRAV